MAGPWWCPEHDAQRTKAGIAAALVIGGGILADIAADEMMAVTPVMDASPFRGYSPGHRSDDNNKRGRTCQHPWFHQNLLVPHRVLITIAVPLRSAAAARRAR